MKDTYFETNPSIFPSLVSTEMRHKHEEIKDQKITKNGNKFILKLFVFPIFIRISCKGNVLFVCSDFKDH